MAMSWLAAAGADVFLAGHLHVAHIGHTAMRYKIEVQDETGIWTDVRGEDGAVLVFDDEQAARAALADGRSSGSWWRAIGVTTVAAR